MKILGKKVHFFALCMNGNRNLIFTKKIKHKK